MAKVGYGSKDAIKLGFGVQEGNVLITNAEAKVHQYPPNSKTGRQSDEFGCVQVTFQLLDKDFEPKGEEDVATMEFGWGDLEKFHPGKATGPDDDDPEDLGTEIDVAGNCIYSDGSRIATSTGWVRLTASMEQCGFKPEVLGNGYLPDLIGTKGHVRTETLEKWPGYKKDDPPTQLVFDKIVGYPYEGKQSSKGGKPKPSAAAKPLKPASPASSVPSVPSGPTSESLAAEILSEIRVEAAGKEMDLKAIRSKATAKLMRRKVPVPQHKAVFAVLADPEFLEAQAEIEGQEFSWDADEGKVIFPETE